MGKIADKVRTMRGQSLAAIVAEIERMEAEDGPAAGEFERWYASYPHKVGRADAAKAFKAARKIASLDDLLDGVQRYIEIKRPDAPYCNPGTWLRQHRWLDQPAMLHRGADFFDLAGDFFDARSGNSGGQPSDRVHAAGVAGGYLEDRSTDR